MHLVGGVAFYEADPGDTVDSVLKLSSTWKNYDVSKVEILSPESPKYGFQDCPLAMVWHNGHVHLVVQRRPKDEPRMWTEKEIERIAALVMDCRVPVLNERAMQADLCGRLEKRNAELQEAINIVVTGARDGILSMRDTFRAVATHLYPLATKATVTHGSNWTIKEESNGL